MPTAKNVTVIPATFNPETRRPVQAVARRRVAAYARVSTDSDEQLTSYEAQVDYYTNYIKSQPDWEFAGVYTDEGLSGLNTSKRTGFTEMIEAAMAGRIDLILTKSVSRFARNTVDSLSMIRKLKEHGTEVYFEKEQIRTFDGKGELLLTIMSSLAQEESRSISENVTWGLRKQFADGKYSVAYSRFLGYRKGADGQMEIDPREAETVRLIYRMFLEGSAPSRIARTLTQEGVPTPAGKQVWQTAVIESILTNEKYKGDARLQKSFTVDYLTKRQKRNEGEVPQYYVTASHPAIILPEEWEQVACEYRRRKESEKGRSTGNAFSGRVFCGECGEAYGPKVWHSNDPYRKVIWQCNAKFGKERRCKTPHLTQGQLEAAYLTALSHLLTDREQLLSDTEALREALSDTSQLDGQIAALAQEQAVVAGLIRSEIEQNAASVQDQQDYQKRYDALSDRFTQIQQKLDALRREKQHKGQVGEAIGVCLRELNDQPELDLAFQPIRFRRTVDRVTVYPDGRLVFRFLVGKEIAVEF